MKTYTDRIALGSGDLFCMEFTGTLPEDEAIEKDENLLGAIKGGASVEYKPTKYTAYDDSGRRSKEIITDEEAKLKSGVITWNGKTLARLCSTARVTESGNRRTVKIGGIKNHDGKKYVLRFLHKDAEDGDCRLTIVGSNEAGFTLAFAKDKEVQIDAEFKAFPHDEDGTLIRYDEEIVDGAAAASVAETDAGDENEEA